jgi:hypothetical protein
MSISSFQTQAAAMSARLSGDLPRRPTSFARIAAEIAGSPVLAFGEEPQQPSEHDADWQRVNSYIADVLKDAHVLYSKLARLQGDFIGGELAELEKISSVVLDLGEQLSTFMKAFHEGDASMMKEKQFGGGSGGGAPPGTPPPAIPAEFKRPEGDFDTELNLEGDDEEFKGFDEGEKKGDDEQGQGQQK